MLNSEVQEYIQSRLQAGENPATIANTIHGWGWRTADAHSKRRKSFSGPSVLDSLTGVIIASLILSGGVFLFNSTTSKTQSVADAVITPKTYAQPAATKPVNNPDNTTAVLGANTSIPSAANLTDTSKDITASAETDLERSNSASSSSVVSKSTYTVALVGDSMIDTLDNYLPKLSEQLKAKYNADFKIYNYGVGSQNVEMGLNTFNQSLSYKGREYPPLSQLKPDVIIIGSFAYNPFSEQDVNKYWLTMAKLAEDSQATGAKVYFLSDIAPVKEKFGVGSLDWPTDIRISHSQKIVEQLNSFIGLSQALNIPLIDVYSASKANSEFGNGAYTDSHDGIHPNDAGKMLVINQIVKDLEVE